MSGRSKSGDEGAFQGGWIVPSAEWIEGGQEGRRTVDVEFESTQLIGDRINAIAQAEAAASSWMSPPPEVCARLDVVINALMDGEMTGP